MSNLNVEADMPIWLNPYVDIGSWSWERWGSVLLLVIPLITISVDIGHYTHGVGHHHNYHFQPFSQLRPTLGVEDSEDVE